MAKEKKIVKNVVRNDGLTGAEMKLVRVYEQAALGAPMPKKQQSETPKTGDQRPGHKTVGGLMGPAMQKKPAQQTAKEK